MLEVAYRKPMLDQDTQRLDISRYLGSAAGEDSVRKARKAHRLTQHDDRSERATSE